MSIPFAELNSPSKPTIGGPQPTTVEKIISLPTPVGSSGTTYSRHKPGPLFRNTRHILILGLALLVVSTLFYIYEKWKWVPQYPVRSSGTQSNVSYDYMDDWHDCLGCSQPRYDSCCM
ncbi:unnamed protein product [Rhizoctonia solani]|uniref:Uncharacterized protein n=1 Tax=Rhizoctonia solani TaxID=456999 RepID=A0A8H3CZM6_9AGAM|nr:unnamed protein product [Rhizoctonia solani]